jgi:serine/threonine protein kinase
VLLEIGLNRRSQDLKADNILVDQEGMCKISDFGISKRTDDINALGAFTNMQGSVFWMAPEVVHNQKKGYNAKIDIWSVGCVVLEMWAGRRPWSNEDVVAVMFKVCTVRLRCPPLIQMLFLYSWGPRSLHRLFRTMFCCH